MQQQKMRIPTLEEIFSNWEATGLKKKIIFTFLVIVLFRLGAQIPLFGINNAVFANLAAGNNIIGFLDMFSGGALGAVCYLLNVPFVSVRKISDNADDVSVSEYTNSVVSDVTAFSDIVLKILEKL